MINHTVPVQIRMKTDEIPHFLERFHPLETGTVGQANSFSQTQIGNVRGVGRRTCCDGPSFRGLGNRG